MDGYQSRTEKAIGIRARACFFTKRYRVMDGVLSTERVCDMCSTCERHRRQVPVDGHLNKITT